MGETADDRRCAATPGVTYDIDGAPRSGAYDLGADEI